MAEHSMNIGEAAHASGVSAKMIRHYEEIGLIQKAKRSSSNYRTYSSSEVYTLRFIKQTRSLGFSMEQIGALLALWQDRRRPSRKVKELVAAHVQDLEARIQELKAMKRVLSTLAAHCHGDDRPDCPILEGLEKSLVVPDSRNTNTGTSKKKNGLLHSPSRLHASKVGPVGRPSGRRVSP